MTDLVRDPHRTAAGRRDRRAGDVVRGEPDPRPSLWPETVSTAVDVERSRTFSLGIDLSFVSAPGLQNGRVFRYQELQPVVTTRGRGTSRFGWTFLESDGQPLVATGRTVFAVLERPRDTPALSGTLLVTAHIRRRSLPSLGPTVARGRPRGFRLNTADGAFELDVTTL